MILPCSCDGGVFQKSGVAYQVAKYGVGNRVHNPFKGKDGKTTLYRCTICGHERGPDNGDVEPAKLNKDKKSKKSKKAQQVTSSRKGK